MKQLKNRRKSQLTTLWRYLPSPILHLYSDHSEMVLSNYNLKCGPFLREAYKFWIMFDTCLGGLTVWAILAIGLPHPQLWLMKQLWIIHYKKQQWNVTCFLLTNCWFSHFDRARPTCEKKDCFCKYAQLALFPMYICIVALVLQDISPYLYHFSILMLMPTLYIASIWKPLQSYYYL